MYVVRDCVCPVWVFTNYLAVRNKRDYFLAHHDGSSVTRFQFRTVFHRCLAAVGIQPHEFGTYSGGGGAVYRSLEVLVLCYLYSPWIVNLLILIEFSISDVIPSLWFLGYSYVHWVAQRAEWRPGGWRLVFPNMTATWQGIGGLLWKVLPEAIEISRVAHPPMTLVKHAGGNDLCQMCLANLCGLIWKASWVILGIWFWCGLKLFLELFGKGPGMLRLSKEPVGPWILGCPEWFKLGQQFGLSPTVGG